MKRVHQFTRRQALAGSAAALLAGGLWPGWAKAQDADRGEDFTFICVNDLHYFNDRCTPFFQQMVKQMRCTEGAEFCLIVGDLAEDGTAKQMGAIHELLRGLKMPIHVVVGNHDYDGHDDRAAFEARFPHSINYQFEHRGWQFVALDTTQGRKASGTSVQRDTMQWLADRAPKLDQTRPTALFTHFPMGNWVPSRPVNADDVLSAFKPVNLRAVFNGHFHAFTERRRGKVVLTTDKCCSFHHANHDGSPEKGYFVCQAKDGDIQRTFVEVKLDGAGTG